MNLGILERHPSFTFLLLSLGFITLSKCTLAILNWVYVSFLRSPKNLKKYGSWALVTGATDGIGKAFSFQLARQGLNLILIGRSPDKLDSITNQVHSTFSHNILIKTVVVDFSKDLSEEVVKRIEEAIDGLDVGILINNVGVSYRYARYFHEVDDELLRNLIKVNVEGTTKVTHVVLGGMLVRKKGAIVNLGSGAASVIPSDALYAVYAATKAYIDQFSKCLHLEYKSKGIDVQCQVPLYVATKMASFRTSTFFIPSPDVYAQAGLRSLGYEVQSAPYWPHSLLWCLSNSLPEFVINGWRMRFNLETRERGLLKDANSKKN